MASKLKYFIIYKPYRILSQFSDEDSNKGLGSVYQLPRDVYPVGRLDLESEGLLLLTNDKKLNNKLLNPTFEHGRTYWVEVEGEPDESSLKALREGVEINLSGKRYTTLPAGVRKLESPTLPGREPPVNAQKHPKRTWLELILREGKNRQVRRMTAKVGHPTLRLVRVAIEDLQLGDMQPGDITMISGNVLHRKLKLG